jgi:hypothetical protein
MGTMYRGKSAQRNHQRRVRLFGLYAANAAIHLKDCSGSDFFCPLCLEHFDSTALDHPVKVDIAHVYPSACGGTLVTMTCKSCNSRAGHQFDSELAKEKDAFNALSGQGTGTIDVRVRVQGIPIGAQISRRGDHFDIVQIKKQSHPNAVEDIKAKMVPGSPANISFEHDKPDEKRIGASLLHSAYLAAFRFFGYEYLIYSDTESIRDALRQNEPPDKLPTYLIDVHDAGPELRNHTNVPTIGFALVDGKHKCLAVAMPHPVPRAARVVLLPGFDPEGAKGFNEIMKRGDVPTPFKYHVNMDDPAQRLSDVRFSNYGRCLWQASFEKAS